MNDLKKQYRMQQIADEKKKLEEKSELISIF